MIFTIFLLIGIFLALIVGVFLGKRIGELRQDRLWQERLPEHRRDAVKRSRAVLSGQFSEQLAPYMPGFSYSPSECRFIGKPIDLIVFKGMDEKQIDELVFVEVKSGSAHLSSVEKSLKEAIQAGRVRWEEFRLD
ncbi:MAG: Holliday junction resolvase-like protein [Candidatus Nanoarchaeia archaeon]